MNSTPHGLGPTRARVLGLLQAATEPTSVVDVATELGLHKNSARFHLDALVDAGFAERAVGVTGQQGRPPLVFTATSDAPTISNIHLMELAQVLISSFIEPSDDAVSKAEGAGRVWGAGVGAQDADVEHPIEELAVHLGERGFGTRQDGDRLTFTRCPFRATIAPDQLPLVCAMHRGFLDGYLEASGTDKRADSLEIGPRLCHATFEVEEPAAELAATA